MPAARLQSCPVASPRGFRFSEPMRHPRSDDIRYMRPALALAERGRGRRTPTPGGGAVVVRDARVVGEGCHRALGEAPAEAGALAAAGTRARGATMFVT